MTQGGRLSGQITHPLLYFIEPVKTSVTPII